MLLLFSPPSSPSLSSLSLSPASCDSLCLPRLSWSASPSPSPHHAPRPLPSLEAQGLGLGGLPAWARGPEWKTVVQTAPPAPTIPQGLSRLSWGLKPPPGPNPNPAQVTPCPSPDRGGRCADAGRVLATDGLVLGLPLGRSSPVGLGGQEAVPLGGGALGRQRCLPSSLPLGSWP